MGVSFIGLQQRRFCSTISKQLAAEMIDFVWRVVLYYGIVPQMD